MSKALFDTIKAIIADRLDIHVARVRLTQAEVDAVNRALFPAVAGEPRRVSAKGVELIHRYESLRLDAYPDPGSRNGLPVTIGWGSTSDLNGKPIQLGARWTKEQADAKFAQDLARFEAGVSQLIGDAPTSQAQFDALVSFAYNVGLDIDDDTKAEGLGDSTLLKHHVAGDYAGAAAEFGKWVFNDGKRLRGLERRRADEADMYRSGS